MLAKGFVFRREPKFVVGRKPDFLTGLRGRIWVEVKELDPPPSQQLLNDAWQLLRHRLTKFQGRCVVHAWVSPGFNAKIAKQTIALLGQELQEGLTPDRELYVAIPAGDCENSVVHFEWTRRNGVRVRLAAMRLCRGKYACPPGAEPANWTDDVQINEAGAPALSIPFFTTFEEQPPNRALLAIHEPRDGQNILAGLGNAEVQRVNTVDRLRDVIEDAKEQIKNAQRYRSIPGVVEVYYDHLGGGDHGDLLRACLGDLTISVAGNGGIIGSFYGLNGVFRPNKNTAVSAVTYRSRHGAPVSLINPHALFPVKGSWLASTVYRVEPTGEVRRG